MPDFTAFGDRDAFPRADDSLTEVRLRLLDLHRALLEAERREHERAHGRLSDGEFLDALINDPAFAWLNPLTTLIVRLEELLEDETAQGATLADCVARIRSLLKPDAGGADFQRRYAEVLQRSPDVVVAHGNAMRALKA